MTDQNLTHLYFLLDRSGSMASIRSETEAGFNAFIAEQRTAPGRCLVTLAQFDDHYEEVYAARPVNEVPPLHLAPRGTTALLDSIGRLVTTAGERLAALPEHDRPGTVIVGIMTDGHENASHEWGFGAVRALIEQQTTIYSWDFLYMGADQDAIEVGAQLGVSREQSLTYDRHRVGSAYASALGNISAMRAARAAGASPAAAREKLAFTEAQRADAEA